MAKIKKEIKVNYIKPSTLSTQKEDENLLARLFVLFAVGIDESIKQGKLYNKDIKK